MDLNNLRDYIIELQAPFCILLVGTPLSGKDTLINHLGISDVEVISRDSIILELCPGQDYNKAFNSVNQKEVDKILKNKIDEISKNKKNVIINLTNLRSKRRKQFLSKFDSDYLKLAIVLPLLTKEELVCRNITRQSTEGKFIPLNVIDEMLTGYQMVQIEEGFNQIINYK